MDLWEAEHGPRMADYLRPDDLDTDGCLLLVREIMAGAHTELTEAVRNHIRHPNSETRAHLESAKRFYRSRYFGALSLGTVDGETALKQIVRDALGEKADALERLVL